MLVMPYPARAIVFAQPNIYLCRSSHECETVLGCGIGNANTSRGEKAFLDSVVHAGCWKGHNVLDVSEFKHCRINHFPLFADKENHIEGIESDEK